jgi:hypothetical protein
MDGIDGENCDLINALLITHVYHAILCRQTFCLLRHGPLRGWNEPASQTSLDEAELFPSCFSALRYNFL